VSASSEQNGHSDSAAARGAAAEDEQGEILDALPVLSEAASVVRSYPFSDELSRGRDSAAAMMPAVQAAAVAAGGFVAGAAVVGLVTRKQRHAAALARGGRSRRSLARGGRKRKSAPTAGELVQIVGSRSLLVDVHLLGGRD
jgi:hypothetical protein